MQRQEHCPQPIIIGGFNETRSNTNESEDGQDEIENSLDCEEMSYAPGNEPTESTGPHQSQKEFIFSHLKGTKPTLLFKRGDTVGGHTVKLIDLFSLIFPFGRGSPDERRVKNILKCCTAILL